MVFVRGLTALSSKHKSGTRSVCTTLCLVHRENSPMAHACEAGRAPHPRPEGPLGLLWCSLDHMHFFLGGSLFAVKALAGGSVLPC